MSEKTLGEQRVRTDFNVEGSDVITQIKNQSAALIDLVETLKEKDSGAILRNSIIKEDSNRT